MMHFVYFNDDFFLNVSCTRFREDVSAIQYLFCYWQFASNQFYPVGNLKGFVFNLAQYQNQLKDIEAALLIHFYCKSKEEYVKRISLGKADSPHILSMDYFYKDDRNEIQDDVMLSYSSDVKK